MTNSPTSWKITASSACGPRISAPYSGCAANAGDTAGLLLGAFRHCHAGICRRGVLHFRISVSFTPAAELSSDARWSATPSDAADYTTRMVVLTRADRTEFNGAVLVEWLNVNGGIDAPAVRMMAHREMVRGGYAYAAVSAQRVGVVCVPASHGRRLLLRHLFPDRPAQVNLSGAPQVKPPSKRKID
ncbi:MAG: alpha/beta hydrolase domain-containing protein [Mycobacterium sp.]